MESSSSENDPPHFWCHICNIFCASALNLHTHFLGAKHKKVEEALRNHRYEEEPKKEESKVENEEPEQATVPGETLMDLLNACKTTEPAVGLEHIYEYHPEGKGSFCIYECRMCHCQTGLSNMFMHVVGAKHRITYLSIYHPDMDIPSHFQAKTPAKNKKLKAACEAVEKTFGRKQINVMKGSHAPRSFMSGPEPLTATNYQPDIAVHYIDFTADDFGIDKKQTKPKQEVTFQELKALHQAKSNKTQASGGPAQSSMGEQDDCESDREVVSMDLSECDPDEFLCNNELLDFLDSFKIRNNADVQFVLKVIEKLSHALVNHKKCEKDVTKMVNDVGNTSDKPSYQQSYDWSDERLNRNPGKNNKQNLQIDSCFNRRPVDKPRSRTQDPSEPGRNYNQNNEQPNRKSHKVSRPAGTLSTTHDERGPNYNYSKQAPNKEFNKGPHREQTTLSPTGQPSRMYEDFNYEHNQMFQTPQLNNTPSTGPRFPTEVPCDQGPNQMPFPAGSFPRKAQFSHEVQESVFPERPKGLPQGVPADKDETTARFFDCIKNMEVSEVVSTLNNIAATNPAFKGIHVPTMIKYLTETGRLKPPRGPRNLQ